MEQADEEEELLVEDNTPMVSGSEKEESTGAFEHLSVLLKASECW